MMASVRAEFRKLLTVRSTYYICGIALLALTFFAFYINGIKAEPKVLLDPGFLADQSIQAMNALAGIVAIAGLLILGHEYRYNTIMYTLTASKSRTRTMLAKIFVISCFAIVVSALITVLSPAMASLGAHLAGHDMAPQVVHVKDVLWRCLFYGWGYSMFALLLIAIIRSQIGAIVALFMTPITVEPLLGLVLKSNAVYLPFAALGQITASTNPEQQNPLVGGHLTPAKAAVVFGIYLAVGWIVAWVLYLKRDAN